jgi:hypothetical protein
MKITGPGQPPTPGAEGVANNQGITSDEGVAGLGSPAGPAGPSPSGKAFAETLAGPTSVDAIRAGGIAGPGQVPVQDLAADLEAGKLDARAAVEQVIDRVLDLQLGRDAPAAVREHVGSALREALESDPLLAAKLRELG